MATFRIVSTNVSYSTKSSIVVVEVIEQSGAIARITERLTLQIPSAVVPGSADLTATVTAMLTDAGFLPVVAQPTATASGSTSATTAGA